MSTLTEAVTGEHKRKVAPGPDKSIVSAYRHTALFYLGATLIPWSLWFTVVWESHRPSEQAWAGWISVVLGLAGLASPMLLAWALIWRDPTLRRDVSNRLLRWPRGSGWYVAMAFGLMPLSILLAQAISLAFGHSVTQFRFAAHSHFSAGFLPAWVILLLAPALEELGWHSYGTDALLRRWSVFTSSMVFAGYWAVWHMPLSGIKDYYHNQVMLSGWIYSLNFLLSLFPFVILMNWVYLKTGRNIMVTVVFHTTAGAFNEVFQTHPDSKVIQTSLLILLSCVLLWRDRVLFFQKPTSD